MSVHCQYNNFMAKVFKNGNSLAVVVPQVYAHQLNISSGSTVLWKQKDEGLLLITENKTKKATEIDPRVIDLIKKISKKYTQVWQDLAKL